MDIGIAKFYLKQYDDAVSFKIESRLNPRNYLLELESHENDSSVRRDVEYNVYEALHQKYRSLASDEQKKACLDRFRALFPATRYRIDDETDKHPNLDSFEEYLSGRLSLLRTVCREINKERN